MNMKEKQMQIFSFDNQNISNFSRLVIYLKQLTSEQTHTRSNLVVSVLPEEMGIELSTLRLVDKLLLFIYQNSCWLFICW